MAGNPGGGGATESAGKFEPHPENRVCATNFGHKQPRLLSPVWNAEVDETLTT